jgi:transcriptional regulator with XRE-family HTH domain
MDLSCITLDMQQKNLVEANQRFAANLKTLMIQKKVKQSDLGKAIGVAQSTVSYFLQGKFLPQSGTIQRIANYFDLPMETILSGKISKIPRQKPDGKTPLERMDEAVKRSFTDARFGHKVDGFPQRLKWLREKLGLSVSDFARQCGCNSARIRQLESAEVTIVRRSSAIKKKVDGTLINRVAWARLSDAVLDKFGVARNWFEDGSGLPFDEGFPKFDETKRAFNKAWIAQRLDEFNAALGEIVAIDYLRPLIEHFTSSLSEAERVQHQRAAEQAWFCIYTGRVAKGLEQLLALVRNVWGDGGYCAEFDTMAKIARKVCGLDISGRSLGPLV